VRSKGNGCFSIDVDQHELVDEMVAEVAEMSDGGCDFCKVADGGWSIDPQTVRFKKDVLFLEPCEKMAIGAVKLNVADASVAEHMAADAYVRLVLFFDASGGYFEEFFEFGLSGWEGGGGKGNLFVVVSSAKD